MFLSLHWDCNGGPRSRTLNPQPLIDRFTVSVRVLSSRHAEMCSDGDANLSLAFARSKASRRTAALALCSRPLLTSARSGPLLKGPAENCPRRCFSRSSAVSSDIYLLSLARLVNLGWGERDGASTDHICPETCFQQHERSRRTVPLSSQPGGPFKSPHIAQTGVSLQLFQLRLPIPSGQVRFDRFKTREIIRSLFLKRQL